MGESSPRKIPAVETPAKRFCWTEISRHSDISDWIMWRRRQQTTTPVCLAKSNAKTTWRWQRDGATSGDGLTPPRELSESPLGCAWRPSWNWHWRCDIGTQRAEKKGKLKMWFRCNSSNLFVDKGSHFRLVDVHLPRCMTEWYTYRLPTCGLYRCYRRRWQILWRFRIGVVPTATRWKFQETGGT